MKQKKDRYLTSLASGYALMILQIVLGMVQIPLALNYLGTEQFGIWVLAAQVAVWLQMLDVGLNGAMARHMIQYKNMDNSALLASCIATGFRVFCIQGLIVILATLLLRNFGQTAFNLSPKNNAEFGTIILLLGICAGATFPVKIVHSWLYATQRLDITNKVTLWTCFFEFAIFALLVTNGWGVYSLAWARLCASVTQIITYWWIACHRSDFPYQSLRTPWNLVMFKDLASFGGGMFVLTLGNQLLNFSQTALVSNQLGLAQAAVWATAPKLTQVGFQIVSKIWDYRMPYLVSFMDDRDSTILIKEFIAVLKVSIYLAAAGLGIVAATNQNFLEVWTHHRIQWPFVNDYLLSLTIFSTLVVRCVTDFVFQAKIAAWMPVLILAEGLAFIALSTWALPRYGITGMIAASLIAGSMFRLPYAWVRFVKHYKLGFPEKMTILLHVCGGLGMGILAYMIPSLIQYVLGGYNTWSVLILQLAAALALLGPLALRLSKHLRQAHALPARE